MPLIRLVAPTAPPVSLEEAKLHLRVDSSEEDTLISSLVAAATQNLDGANGWLGRALMPQTWRLDLPGLPGRIALPLPPLIAVEAVTYLDQDGAEQTLAPSAYQVSHGGEWLSYLEPTPGASWPASRRASVIYRCGYSGDAYSPPVAVAAPEPIRAAIKLLVGHWFANRDAVVLGAAAELPLAVTALLYPLRVSWL